MAQQPLDEQQGTQDEPQQVGLQIKKDHLKWGLIGLAVAALFAFQAVGGLDTILGGGQPAGPTTAATATDERREPDQPTETQAAERASSDGPQGPVNATAEEVMADPEWFEGRFTHIEFFVGRVSNAPEGGAVFIGRGSRGFSVVVFQSAYENFVDPGDTEKEGVAAPTVAEQLRSRYMGSRVKVSGVVELYQGTPEVIISGPSQIETVQ